MKDVLIIKTHLLMKPDAIKKLRESILKQIESGVVVIPAYYDAELINVPDDVEVIIDETETLMEAT